MKYLYFIPFVSFAAFAGNFYYVERIFIRCANRNRNPDLKLIFYPLCVLCGLSGRKYVNMVKINFDCLGCYFFLACIFLAP